MCYLPSKHRHTTSSFHRSNDEPTSNRLSWPQFYQRNRSNLSTTKINDDDRQRRESSTSQASYTLEKVLCPDEARVIQRANQIVMYVINIWFGGDGDWSLVRGFRAFNGFLYCLALLQTQCSLTKYLDPSDKPWNLLGFEHFTVIELDHRAYVLILVLCRFQFTLRTIKS